MIKIDVIGSKKCIVMLKKMLSSYKLNHDKIEYEYNNILLHWVNDRAIEFFLLVNNNQIENQKIVYELKNQSKRLDVAVNKYADIGDSIECNLDSVDYISSKFSNINDKIDKVVNKFNEIDNINSGDYKYKIFLKKQRLMNLKSEVKNINDKILTNFKQVKLIEKSLKSDFDDEIIKNNLDIYDNKHIDVIKFDVDEIRISNKKLKLYFRKQLDLVEKLKLTFVELNKYYKSNNFDKLFSYNNEFIFNKLMNVNKYGIKLCQMIDDTCDDYDSMIRKNINNLESL